MNGRWRLATILLILCCFGSRRGTAGEEAVPNWFDDWEQGRKAALESGKPLFVVFRCRH